MSSDQISNNTLIQALASGQGWAMAILYQRYSALLYAFAYRIVADHQMAENLLQESFLVVWQRASSCSPKLGAVYTWLAAITHHRAIDYVRSRRSHVVFTLGEVKTTSNAPSPDAWDEVWHSEGTPAPGSDSHETHPGADRCMNTYALLPY